MNLNRPINLSIDLSQRKTFSYLKRFCSVCLALTQEFYPLLSASQHVYLLHVSICVKSDQWWQRSWCDLYNWCNKMGHRVCSAVIVVSAASGKWRLQSLWLHSTDEETVESEVCLSTWFVNVPEISEVLFNISCWKDRFKSYFFFFLIRSLWCCYDLTSSDIFQEKAAEFGQTCKCEGL